MRAKILDGKQSDSMRGLEQGEEIYMSYGPHPNDFLLIECKLLRLLESTTIHYIKGKLRRLLP